MISQSFFPIKPVANRSDLPKFLKEVCGNCGLVFAAHCAMGNVVRNIQPGCCPGFSGRMDWLKGPGTTFKATGIFRTRLDIGKKAERWFPENYKDDFME